MINVKFNVIGGRTEKIVQLIGDYAVNSLEVNRKIDVNMIKSVSKLCESPDEALDNFVYTIIKDFSKQIIEYLVEGTQYINDTQTVYYVTMYCKRIEREEIEIMSEEKIKEFKSLLIEFFNEHWEYPAVKFNDKEFMENLNN
jgi:hypothetical protein